MEFQSRVVNMLSALLISILICEISAKPFENIDASMLRRRMDNNRAVSYVYRSDNNGPPQVYYLNAEDLNKNLHSQPIIYYQAPPVTQAYYDVLPVVHHVPQKPVNTFHRNLASLPSSSEYDESPKIGPRTSSSSEESIESGENESGLHSSENDHSSEKGQSHGDQFHKKKGDKSNKGYNSEFKFQKGKKGSYHTENNSGGEEAQGDKSSSKYDEADNHSEHNSKENHEKGGKYGHKKHHKKGSKSKGYHNVFMKDEYKKDHTFYDTADHQGHYSKHGSDHVKHLDEEGESKKGAHFVAGSKEAHSSDKHEKDKGHYDKNDEGHKNKSGNEESYQNFEKYAKKNDHHHSKQSTQH